MNNKYLKHINRNSFKYFHSKKYFKTTLKNF